MLIAPVWSKVLLRDANDTSVDYGGNMLLFPPSSCLPPFRPFKLSLSSCLLGSAWGGMFSLLLSVSLFIIPLAFAPLHRWSLICLLSSFVLTKPSMHLSQLYCFLLSNSFLFSSYSLVCFLRRWFSFYFLSLNVSVQVT